MGALIVFGRAGQLAAAPLTGPGGTPVAEDAGRLAAVRTRTAPVLDGKLDDPVWTSARGTSDFTQQIPHGGKSPSERTTLRVLYDDDALYIGFDCEQRHSPISRRLTRRDADSESDWIWVYVDSRRDGRAVPLFAVSVAGVLADGIAHEDGHETYDWDENWEGEVAITPTGWSAELRIPMRILRFSEDQPVQSWGIWASRYVAMRQERSVWPYIPRETPAPIPYFGRLDDLRNLRPGGRVELRPFVVGRVLRRDADPTLVESGYAAGASAGLDAKVHITPSLTLDAAVNPDFAQVESDRLILNLNNYEILYPEKRPLFTEGADAFLTPLNLFYSRRIGSSPATPTARTGTGPGAVEGRLVEVPAAATIYGAAKVIGRVRDWLTVGALSALASRNDYVVELPDRTRQRRTVEPLSAYSVLRLRGDLDARAHLGLIATAANRFESMSMSRICPDGATASFGGRCFRDAYVGGVDGLWRSSSSHYVATGQVVGSTVRDGLPEIQLDGTSINPGDKGFGGTVRLAKDGGDLVVAELAYTGSGRKLTYNDLGFMPRQNLHEGKAAFGVRTLQPGALTLERHARIEVTARRNLDGLDLGRVAELNLKTRLTSFWQIMAAVQLAPARFDDREIGDGSALERARYLGFKLAVDTDPRRALFGALQAESRVLEGGFAGKVEASLVARLAPELEIELAPQLAIERGEPRSTWHATMGLPPDQYVFGVLRASSVGAFMRASYAFTPRLTLQSFAQLFLAAGHYESFSVAPAVVGSRISRAALVPLAGPPPTDADFEEAALNVNVVLRWEYRLGSTLFLVYSRSQAPTVSLAPGDPADIRLSSIRRVPAIDAILLKWTYWWAS